MPRAFFLILFSVLLAQQTFADPPAMLKACDKKGDYLFDLGGARQCLNRDEHAVLCKLRGYSQEQCFEIFDAQIAGKLIKPPVPVNAPVTREERMKQHPNAGWVKTDQLGKVRAKDETCPSTHQYIPRPNTKKGFMCVKRGTYYKKRGNSYFTTTKCDYGTGTKVFSQNPKVELPVCLEKGEKAQNASAASPAPAVAKKSSAEPAKTVKQPVPNKPAPSTKPIPEPGPKAWQKYLQKTGKTLTGSKNSKQTRH